MIGRPRRPPPIEFERRPRCSHGGCASLDVRLYRVPNLKHPRPLCLECHKRLVPIYGELVAVGAVTADRRA